MQWGIVLDVKDSAEITKEVVVMVVMEDVMEEEEVVDKVTKMAADWIGIRHRLTDVRSLIFWWILNHPENRNNVQQYIL